VAFALEKALKAKVVMLSGDEDALRTRALQEIMTAATLEDVYDLEVLDGGDSTPMQWSASAGTAPFLSSRRTVVVRHLLRYGEIETPGWSNLPESAWLVLVADDEGGDDSKQNKLATLRGKWETAVKSLGGHVEVFKVDPRQVVESIRQEAIRLGKKMTPKAGEALAEMCGGSLSRATDELEKVALYVGNADQISEVDVRAAAMPSREWNVYKMVDAAISGDAGEAVRNLRILVGSVNKAEDAAFQRILPTLQRQLRLIWQARIILDRKADPENLPESVANVMPENPQWSKQAPFVRNKAMRAARSTSFDQLSKCFQLLSDADARLKAILPGYSAMETLEQMLLEMIEVLRLRPAA
jgi:DNA polymerase-3 subunit delta